LKIGWAEFKYFLWIFWRTNYPPGKIPLFWTWILLLTGLITLLQILHEKRYAYYLLNNVEKGGFHWLDHWFRSSPNFSSLGAFSSVHGYIQHRNTSFCVALDRYELHLVPWEFLDRIVYLLF
jgi:hypothetical protein